jgi:sulfoacetaldehyde acetyltransferase
MTMGQGGFQEVPQMAVFEDMVAYQEEVLHPSRMAEVLNRVIMQAKRASAPAQINMPRDFWTQVIDIELPPIVEFERAGRRRAGHRPAAELLSNAKFPVILNGGGVVIGGAIPDSKALAERLDAPVCCGYQHNDAFPGSHPLFAGPLGYNGSKAGMELIAKADVVLALGTRLNPFSTLPGYGIDYWPARCRHHPGGHQSRPHRPDQAGHRGHRRGRQKGGRAILASSPTAGDAGREAPQGHHR